AAAATESPATPHVSTASAGAERQAGSSAEAPSRRTLEGTWDASVRTTIPSEGETTLTFLADGTLAPPDTGTWCEGPNGAFSFELRYTNYDENGEVVGHTEGYQHGQLSPRGETFTSSGVSTVYDTDGAVVRIFELDIEAVRA
uniref:hypothetical protein n=1 Tax=Saccharomonospora saliphila TaxID=369829 RepID=UPI0018DE5EF2